MIELMLYALLGALGGVIGAIILNGPLNVYRVLVKEVKYRRAERAKRRISRNGNIRR